MKKGPSVITREQIRAEFIRNLARDDNYGKLQRASAVRGYMRVLDHLTELAEGSRANYTFLTEWLATDGELTDQAIEEIAAPDAHTITILVDILDHNNFMFRERLQHAVMTELRQFWALADRISWRA